MPLVEFIVPFKCYKAGDRKDVPQEFAGSMISLGYAKAVDTPPRHKMMISPVEKKNAT